MVCLEVGLQVDGVRVEGLVHVVQRVLNPRVLRHQLHHSARREREREQNPHEPRLGRRAGALEEEQVEVEVEGGE